MKTRFKRFGFSLFVALFVALLALGLSACSPGFFFGSDDSDSKLPNYRSAQVRSDCQGLSLRGGQFDVPSFRDLSRCLNSNGALGPAGDLVTRIKDADLAPIVAFINRNLLGNPSLLYSIKETLNDLEKMRRSENAFRALGMGIERAVFLLESIPSSALSQRDQKEMVRLLSKLFNQKRDPKAYLEGMETAIDLVGSAAFLSLGENLESGLKSNRMNPAVTAMQSFLGSEKENLVLAEVLARVADGSLARAFDRFFEEDLESGVKDFVELVHYLFEGPGERFYRLNDLAKGLDRPTFCFKGGSKIPNGTAFALEQIASQPNALAAALHLGRYHSNFRVLANSFCDDADGVDFSFLKEISKSGAVDPAWKLLVSLSEKEVLLPSLAHVLSSSSMEDLVPLTLEVRDRGWLEDLILLFTVLPTTLQGEENSFLNEAIGRLLEPDSSFSEGSAYLFLVRVLGQFNSLEFSDALEGLRNFVFGQNEPPENLGFLLREARHLYLLNESHPLIELFHGVLADASRNERFFESLVFLLEEAQLPRFKEALLHIAEMARDGRLEDVIRSTFQIFENLVSRGAHSIERKKVPTFLSRVRHSWDRRDFLPIVGFEGFEEHSLEISPGCDALDLSFRIDRSSREITEDDRAQILHYAQCLNSSGDHPELEQAVQSLLGLETEEGESAFSFHIRLIQDFFGRFDREALRELLLSWSQNYESGRIDSLFQAGLLANRAIRGEQSAVSSGLELIGALQRHEPSALRDIQQLAADFLRSDGVPTLLRFSDELDSRKLPGPAPKNVSFDRSVVEAWVSELECDSSAVENGLLGTRVDEVIEAYRESLNNWEGMREPPHFRRSLDFETFWGDFKEVLNQAPRAEGSEISLFDAFKNALVSFSRGESEDPEKGRIFHSGEFYEWLWSMAHYQKMIPYFYPGEEKPRARWVNGFDLIEILLINSDVSVLRTSNLALKYLKMISEAWGDEPRALWPDEIQEKFEGDSQPILLAKVVRKILADVKLYQVFLGTPDFPSCTSDFDVEELPNFSPFWEKQKGAPLSPSRIALTSEEEQKVLESKEARELELEFGSKQRPLKSGREKNRAKELRSKLFNFSQAISVFEESLPDSGNPLANGMRMLRNLIFEVYRATPEEFRNPKLGPENKHRVLIRLARMGLLRQIGKALVGAPAPDSKESQEYRDFVDVIVGSGRTDALVPMLRGVFEGEDRREWVKGAASHFFDYLDRFEQGSVGRERLKAFLFYFFSSFETLGKNLGKTLGKNLEPNEDVLLGRALHLLQQMVDSAPSSSQFFDEFLGVFLRSGKEIDARLPLFFQKVYFSHQFDSEKEVDPGQVAKLLRTHFLDGGKRQTQALSALRLGVQAWVNPELRTRWDVFHETLGELRSLPEFQILDLDEHGDAILLFFQEREAFSRRLAPRFRFWLADRLEVTPGRSHSDLEQIFLWIEEDPAGYAPVIGALPSLAREEEYTHYFNGLIDILESGENF